MRSLLLLCCAVITGCATMDGKNHVMAPKGGTMTITSYVDGTTVEGRAWDQQDTSTVVGLMMAVGLGVLVNDASVRAGR